MGEIINPGFPKRGEDKKPRSSWPGQIPRVVQKKKSTPKRRPRVDRISYFFETGPSSSKPPAEPKNWTAGGKPQKSLRSKKITSLQDLTKGAIARARAACQC